MTAPMATPVKAKAKLKRAFRQHFGLGSKRARDVLAGAKLYDKAYELACLVELVSKLKAHDSSLTFTLIGGTKVVFRNKGGPINRGRWPFIRIADSRRTVGELWVDIEFQALSSFMQHQLVSHPPYGRGHELDVVLVEPGASGYPNPEEIHLGVEAKRRHYNKALLKELLGVRREMTFRQAPIQNRFVWWGLGTVPADPPSGLVAFGSRDSILKYNEPADFYGIEMIHFDW